MQEHGYPGRLRGGMVARTVAGPVCVAVLAVLVLAGCHGPRPIIKEDGQFVYEHMENDERLRAVQAAAEQRCVTKGMKSKYELSKCWIIGAKYRDPYTQSNSYCYSYFRCVPAGPDR